MGCGARPLRPGLSNLPPCAAIEIDINSSHCVNELLLDNEHTYCCVARCACAHRACWWKRLTFDKGA
eukprot:5235953-Pyramimonas_sp.AAC.1